MTAVRSGTPERRRSLQCVRLVEEAALKTVGRKDSGVRVPNTALIHSAKIQKTTKITSMYSRMFILWRPELNV